MKLILSEHDLEAIEAYKKLSYYCSINDSCEGCIFKTYTDKCMFDIVDNIGDNPNPFMYTKYEVEN